MSLVVPVDVLPEQNRPLRCLAFSLHVILLILLRGGCGVVAADARSAEPARPGSLVTACDFAFRCICFLWEMCLSFAIVVWNM